jgi:hypothetical protein
MLDWTEILIAGVLIAIPVSIIANLLTNPVQRKLEARIKSQSVRREQEKVQFRAQVVALAADRGQFSTYLTTQILRTTFYTALFGLASGLLFSIGQASSTAGSWEFADLFFLSGQLAALMGSLIVLTVVRSALQTASAVREEMERNPATGAQDPPDST